MKDRVHSEVRNQSDGFPVSADVLRVLVDHWDAHCDEACSLKLTKAGKLVFMNTTIDLPESLVREMKLRAVKEGRKLKDVATEVFREGLRAPRAGAERTAYRQTLDAPLFVCNEAKASAPGMTVADLLKLER